MGTAAAQVRPALSALLLFGPLIGCARPNPLFNDGSGGGTGGSGDDGRPTRGPDSDADAASDSQSGSDADSQSGSDADSDSMGGSGSGSDGCLPNFECAPYPDGPWLGPVTYANESLTKSGTCSPGAYDQLIRSASVGAVPPEDVQCCECEGVEAVCETPTRIFSEIDTCDAKAKSAFGDGEMCMPTIAVDSGWMAVSVDEVAPPSCAPIGASEGNFDGLLKARICGTDAPASPCDGGRCVPEAAPNDAICVYTESDRPCPEAWNVRHEMFFPLTPDCGECTCLLPGGPGCRAEISRFGEANCAGDESSGQYIGCNPTTDLAGFASHVFAAVPLPIACQPMPGSGVTSAVERDGVWTVCCLE